MINARLYSRQEIDSRQWDDFIQQSPQQVIYARSGYLDSVCLDWQAVICKEGDAWLGVLPMNIRTKFSKGYTLKPPFVQYLGICLAPMTGKSHKVLHQKQIIIDAITDAIPERIQLFSHNLNPNFDYFVPLHWKGFKLRPMHSYCLDLTAGESAVFSNFSDSVSKRIRRTQKMNLVCEEHDSVTALIDMMLTRGIISPEDGPILERLWTYLREIGTGFTKYIVDPDTREVYAAGIFLIDADKVIILASALDYRFKKTGAHLLMMWEGMRKAMSMGHINNFDFAGSMIESIEHYNRAFGATPVAYYNFSYNRLNWVFRAGYALKQALAAVKKSRQSDLNVTVDATPPSLDQST
jgi:hypothetical protein